MDTCVGVIVTTILKQNATGITETISSLGKSRISGLFFTELTIGEEFWIAAKTFQINPLAALLLFCS